MGSFTFVSTPSSSQRSLSASSSVGGKMGAADSAWASASGADTGKGRYDGSDGEQSASSATWSDHPPSSSSSKTPEWWDSNSASADDAEARLRALPSFFTRSPEGNGKKRDPDAPHKEKKQGTPDAVHISVLEVGDDDYKRKEYPQSPGETFEGVVGGEGKYGVSPFSTRQRERQRRRLAREAARGHDPAMDPTVRLLN
jgi:hypothetical protein